MSRIQLCNRRHIIKIKYGFFLVTAVFAVIGFSASCSGDGSDDTDIYAERMQGFVTEISVYAKNKKPGFIIIPQNGVELAFNYTDIGEGIKTSYVNAIDGIGVEELFYNDGPFEDDGERLPMLKKLKQNKPALAVMVSDYVPVGLLDEAFVKYKTEYKDFIFFPREAGGFNDNFEYMFIPGYPPASVSSVPVSNIGAAKNYLYLISTDQYTKAPNNEPLSVYLADIAATNYDVVLIDLFYNDIVLTAGDINQLRTKPVGEDRLLIAYINIGALEKFRYYWTDTLNETLPSWAKKEYDGWPDEYWVEFWNQQWKDIIFGKENSYIDKIIAAGFDGAYLDNVEAYYFLLNDD